MGDPRSIQAIVAAGLLTVVGVVATLVVWNRVRGWRPLRVAQRVALIVVCQLTAILLTFTVVNHVQGFYESWWEIIDPVPAIPVITHAEQSGSPSPGTDGRPDGAHGPDKHDEPSAGGGADTGHGATQDQPTAGQQPAPVAFAPGPADTSTVHLVGKASDVEGDVFVWTPPGDGPAHTSGYHVLLALGGHPGQPIDGITYLDLEKAVTAAMQAGEMPPTIIVAATTNIAGHDRGCADVPGSDRVATWLTEDVPDIVMSSFHVASDARWSVIGYSSGGYCAARLTMTKPDLFVAGVSIAGDNLPDAPDLQDTPERRSANDLRTIAAPGAAPGVHLLLATSKQDGDTSQQARALSEAAGPGVTVDLETMARGGHNAGVWVAMVAPALAWLGKHAG